MALEFYTVKTSRKIRISENGGELWTPRALPVEQQLTIELASVFGLGGLVLTPELHQVACFAVPA